MDMSEATMNANKAAVLRFNREFIERGDDSVFHALMASDFVNRSAPPGSPAGPEGILYFFNQILRPAFPDLVVEIHEQMAEGDKVSTCKTIHGTHRGELFGIAPTNKPVAIEVIDIVRFKGGRLVEHWGLTSMESVVASLQKSG